MVEVFGPTLEYLTSPQQPETQYCVMIGTIPASLSVPLHSHADVESFYVLSGAVQVLTGEYGSFEWLHAAQGSFVHVPGGAKHAFRNTTKEPVVTLITTTPKLGRFFQEAGRQVTSAVPLPPPAEDDIARFLRVSDKYGYWNATPEENAAVGLNLLSQHSHNDDSISSGKGPGVARGAPRPVFEY
jgi:quercetin dioxygenase-like cupin family protein